MKMQLLKLKQIPSTCGSDVLQNLAHLKGNSNAFGHLRPRSSEFLKNALHLILLIASPTLRTTASRPRNLYLI